MLHSSFFFLHAVNSFLITYLTLVLSKFMLVFVVFISQILGQDGVKNVRLLVALVWPTSVTNWRISVIEISFENWRNMTWQKHTERHTVEISYLSVSETMLTSSRKHLCHQLWVWLWGRKIQIICGYSRAWLKKKKPLVVKSVKCFEFLVIITRLESASDFARWRSPRNDNTHRSWRENWEKGNTLQRRFLPRTILTADSPARSARQTIIYWNLFFIHILKPEEMDFMWFAFIF